MNRKFRGRGLGIAGALLTLLAGSVHAEGPAIGGYVDTQYGYNFASPVTGVTTLRSFDSQDNTISNTAHLALTGALDGDVNYTVELDAGHDANTTVGGTSASGVALQEAYLAWSCPVTHIGIKAGKFVTFEGIEVIETNANPTISRGYLFGLAEPFTHVGGVLTYAIGKLDFAAGVVNGWDVPNDNNTGKTLVGKIGFNFGDPLSATLSGYHGPEQSTVVSSTTGLPVDGRNGANRDSIDLTLVTKIIPKVDLWLQGNLGTERQVVDKDGDGVAESRGSWSGAAVQPLVHVSEKFTIGSRLEYFADKDGARTGVTDASATNFTVTPGYAITKNVQVRAEYRYDTSNKKLWVDDKGVAKDNASTGTIQVVVGF